MKKIIFITALIITCYVIGAKAQVESTSVLNYSSLEKRLANSNKAIENPKKSVDPKTWLSRGELMMEIYGIHLQYLRQGMGKNELIILFGQPKEIRQIQQDGTIKEEYHYERIIVVLQQGKVVEWRETSKIHEDPLNEAIKSFNKVVELDVNGKYNKKLTEDLKKLKQYLAYEAELMYRNKNYEKSYEYFSKIIMLNDWPVLKGTVDTIMYYFAGLMASEAGMEQNAIEMLNKALNLKFKDPNLYATLAKSYKSIGDTTKAFEILNTGIKEFPESQILLAEIINYYLNKNQHQKALDYLKKAEEGDPNNITFIFAEATIYEKLGQSEKAIETYKKCLELNPEYFNAYFNIGIVYYQKGYNINNRCQEIESNIEYKKCMTEADEEFKKAIPYLEKAKEVATDLKDKCETLRALKSIYFRLNDENNLKRINDEIANTCQ